MERKRNIAFFMGMLENEYSNAVLDGAMKAAEDYDINLIVFPMDLINAEYAEVSVNLYRYQYNVLSAYMDADSLDGVIVEYATIVSSLNDEQKKTFLESFPDKPIILLSEESDKYSSVCIENSAGFIELIEHLILDHKYTKIGYLSGPKDNFDAETRLQVFIDTMNKHNMNVEEDWIEYGNFSPFIEEQVRSLIGRHPDMEVLVCANDAMTAGACETMRKMGIVPGKDMFVTGVDNISSCVLFDPPITSVDTNPSMQAYRAVEELINYDPKPHTVYVQTKKVVRESCGCHEFEIDETVKKSYGIYEDWRQTAQARMEENLTRRELELELGNITREMAFARDTEKERYESIMKTVRRLGFRKCSIFLYDEYITHKKYAQWINPKEINLVGYYTDLADPADHIYEIGERKIDVSHLFDNSLFKDEQRHIGIVLPLFFGEKQMGLFIAETDKSKFIYAYDMAGQISNTLFLIELNEEQKRMKQALEEASKSKSKFLANMSHEIRTPINAIIGFNEMIIRENENVEIDEYAQDIKNAANSLLMIVNDTLDFSKIEAGKMEVINDSYSISGLTKSIISMLTSRAEDKGLSLIYEFDESIPDRLIGDYGKVQQILVNLLTNAIKYTNEGTVTLSVNGQYKDKKAIIEFSVTDTGIGIKQEDIGHLFNAFERIEEKRNRHIEGTGLGMNIVTGLLKLMGSELKVSSVYGSGSTFTFSLEQQIDSDGGRQDTSTDTAQNKISDYTRFEAPDVRLLVVDDNALNRKVFGSLLKETKMLVDKAESGKKCLEMLTDNKYDIVFLDHMMPEMDGIETLEEIDKRNLIDRGRTSVIALTANAISGARETYLESGFDDYLPKPVLPKNLYSMIIKYIDSDRINYI